MNFNDWLVSVGTNGPSYGIGQAAARTGPGSPQVMTDDSPSNVQKTPSGLAYISNSADSWVNAYNQEKAWLRDDMIRKEGYQREDSAYQRLFADLQAAGVNPAVLLGGAQSMIGSSGQSASTFKTSNYDETSKTQQANGAKIFAAIASALALVGAALL